MVEFTESEITTERWRYNSSSRLYFLSTENDPRREERGCLVAGNFTRFLFTKLNDSPLNKGLHNGIYLSFGNEVEEWTNDEIVLFDPWTKVYQIGARQWKHTERGMRFRDLDNSVAPHVLYHKERFYTAPIDNPEEFDPLFKILAELQKAKKERNRGVWWL